MAVQMHKGHRDNRLMKHLKPEENTKGREFMNTVVIPRFAKFFKGDDLIYNIGQHVFWDYSLIFNNFERRCNYLTTDTDPLQGTPDIIDDITQSKLESNTADGIMMVGMSDVVPEFKKALSEIFRILKPGGRLLMSYHGTGMGTIFDLVKDFKIDEMYFNYGPSGLGWTEMYSEGEVDSYFVICRKPKI
jgi:SAM-dependent methyltransferase